MRRQYAHLLAVMAGAAGLFSLSLVAPSDAEAAKRRHVVRTARTQPVVITPRYLTAGTAVPYSETRGAIPNIDARYRSTGIFDVSGSARTPSSDPFYLPRPHSVVVFDSPFGRKLPGEQ